MEKNIVKEHINYILGDILDCTADAMILSASSDIEHPVGTGLDKKVYEEAGRDELIAERERVLFEDGKTKLRPGDIFVTSAGSGKLKTVNHMKYIIHVVTPRYRKRYIERDIDRNLVFLKDVIVNIFYKVEELNIKKLVMPLIGTGYLGFRQEDVYLAINEAFVQVWKPDDKFLDNFRVTIVCQKKTDEKKKRMERLSGVDKIIKIMHNYGFDIPDFGNLDYVCVKRWVDSMDDTIVEITNLSKRSRDFKELKGDMVRAIIEKRKHTKRKEELEKPKNEFYKLIEEYMAGKMSSADLCKKANIQKSIISKLKTGKSEYLERDTVIKIALAFELPLDKAKNFIKVGSAGLEFPNPNDDKEMIIAECIENGIYDVDVIEDRFEEYPEYSKAKHRKKVEPEMEHDDIVG